MLKTRHFLYALSLVSAMAVSAAQAQNAASEGPGSKRCETLVQAKAEQPESYREYAVWISGFLTAANAYEQGTFDLTPWQPIEVSLAQVTQFCDANPQATLSQAMSAYIVFLKPDRLREEESLTQVQNGKTAAFIYPSVLQKMRGKLIEKGFLIDTAPQEFGPEIGEALLRFQRARGLTASGLPDGRTLLSLFK